MSEAGRNNRVAVFLRTEIDVGKVRHSLQQLAGGATYDLYVLAHEESGWEMDFGDVPKLVYTRATLIDMGFPADEPGFLLHCADAVYAVAEQQAPGYEWYVFIDRDVLIRPTTPGYFDRLAAELLSRPEGSVDVAAPLVRGTAPDWYWHPVAAQRYERVMSACVPVAALSRRALSHLVAERLREVRQARAGRSRGAHAHYPEDLVFVDAFVASATVAAGLALVDLETLLPGSYTLEEFNRREGRPMGGERLEAPPALAHPVFDDGAMLEDRFSESSRAASLDEFLSDLEARAWPVSENVCREFQDRLIVRASAPEPAGRVAVLLLTHVDNPTVRNLLAELGRGTGYDFYILAHEEPGREMDFGPTPKLSHSMQTFRDLGFEVPDPYFLLHCADLLFGFVQAQAPGYDWYVLVENDVLIHPAEPGYFDRLAARLRAQPPGSLDLVVPKLMFSNPGWMWHGAVARRYGRVLSSFFPVVALSARAAPFLLQERLDEQQRLRAAGVRLSATSHPDNVMFCEGFIASALWAGGYRVTDLNQVSPGSYTVHGFNFGPPRLLSEEHSAAEAALAHPVLQDRDFLDKLLGHSWRTRTLDTFVSDLRRPRWPSIPEPLLREFEEKALQELALQSA